MAISRKTILFTYQCVHNDKSIPVNALHVRIAVLIRTPGLDSGFGPSKDGDQLPPIGMASDLPILPTRKLIRRDGCTRSSISRSFSSAVIKHFLYSSVIVGIAISITCHRICLLSLETHEV